MRKAMITAMVLSLAVFLVAGVMVYQRNLDGAKDAEAFADMSAQLQALITANAQAESLDDAAGADGEPIAAAEYTVKEPRTLEETDDPALLAYREMAQTQPDLAGWLKIEGTVIDYPVMRSPEEPERYLHLNYQGQYSRAGTPFMLPISDPAVPNENIIIYGHHMKDDSMFGMLPVYEDYEAYLDQPYIQFDTLYERGTYKIIAIFRTSIGADNEFPYYLYEWLDNEETFNRYMRGVRANQLYDTGETAEYGDQLLSLSTCDYHEPNGRLVLVAKKVVETEETNDAA